MYISLLSLYILCIICNINGFHFQNFVKSKHLYRYKKNSLPGLHISSSSSSNINTVTDNNDWSGSIPSKRTTTRQSNINKNVHSNNEELGFQSPLFRSGFVTILGNPNVGKSTLLNRLLREDLCIVSPKPQTTRHRIHGILTVEPKQYDGSSSNSRVASCSSSSSSSMYNSNHNNNNNKLIEYERDGYQLVFSDTPGMLKPAYRLQEIMQNTVSYYYTILYTTLSIILYTICICIFLYILCMYVTYIHCIW